MSQLHLINRSHNPCLAAGNNQHSKSVPLLVFLLIIPVTHPHGEIQVHAEHWAVAAEENLEREGEGKGSSARPEEVCLQLGAAETQIIHYSFRFQPLMPFISLTRFFKPMT